MLKQRLMEKNLDLRTAFHHYGHDKHHLGSFGHSKVISMVYGVHIYNIYIYMVYIIYIYHIYIYTYIYIYIEVGYKPTNITGGGTNLLETSK